MTEGLVSRPAINRHDAPRAGRRVIRVASTNEAAVLSCLHRSLTRDTFSFEDCLGADPDATASIVLVCEVSEAIAGYLCLGDPHLMGAAPAPVQRGAASRQWELRALGVAPQFRRTSVASDLWRVAIDRLPATVLDVSGVLRADRVSAAQWLRTRGFALATTTAGRTRGSGCGQVQPEGGIAETQFHASIAALREHLASTGPSTTERERVRVEPGCPPPGRATARAH